MQVFISWSGDPSKAVAGALKSWLRYATYFHDWKFGCLSKTFVQAQTGVCNLERH